MPSNTTFLQDLLSTIAERGRQLIPQNLLGGGRRDDIQTLARALLSSQGEASGVAIAREILTKYRDMSTDSRRAFVSFVAESMQPDRESVLRAATSFIARPDESTMSALQIAVESPRQEFFRRLNLAPGATSEIVALRADLLKQGRPDAALRALDQDLQHLLYSWFNRGFLVLRRIDWQTPAAVLEKIIAYEAVHEIKGWEDLRRRLDPADRRLFAFFHPAMVDEPLIFVEVALTDIVPSSIQAVLTEHRKPAGTRIAPTVAVFYSISNCQEGLRGISFGNFLIKQVVEELARELPTLKTFVTLSPVPGFARWLDREMGSAPERADALVTGSDRAALGALRSSRWIETEDEGESLRGPLMAAAAAYFLRAKTADGHPVDPVARFHLGNGARLDRLNWLGDISEKGMREAHGLMVNYRYELDEIEANHEAYENALEVAASKSVRGLLKAPEKPRAEITRKLPPPGR